jgi:hypothetical protein
MRTLQGLLGAIALALATADLSAQGLAAWDEPGPRISAEDSIALFRAARSDQATFERLRRSRLPETWSRSGGYCDERVGRFCLTHGSGRDDWVAPPEDERVARSRSVLIDGLGGAAGLIPGDGWIAGQRVRYLVEARRFDEAVTAARECKGEAWWCAALRGFAHHYAARPLQADSAFDIALAAMDEPDRQRWTDLLLILDHRSARTYRRIADEDRASFEDRFWRLADPLLTRPGNELRAEHFSRHVWDALQDRAQSTDGLSWGFDLREILIRYGWPAGWERTRAVGMRLGPPPMVTHYSGAPQYMLPPSHALLDETGTAGEWDVEEPRARTGYNVPMADSVARWFTPLAHQVAVFRRADSAFVVAGYELPADSVPADARVEAGFALMATTEPLGEPVITLDSSSAIVGSMAVRAEARPLLMSLEVLVPDERRIARARYGLDIAPVQPALLAVSDLLLLREADQLPDSLPDAIPIARGSGRVEPGERIGVYWEIYGVVAETTPELAMSLRLLERRTGLLRRFAERVGLMREFAPIRLRWEEAVSSGPYIPRSLAIQIPEIPPGSYTLELSVEAPGRETLFVRRDLDVVGGTP